MSHGAPNYPAEERLSSPGRRLLVFPALHQRKQPHLALLGTRTFSAGGSPSLAPGRSASLIPPVAESVVSSAPLAEFFPQTLEFNFSAVSTLPTRSSPRPLLSSSPHTTRTAKGASERERVGGAGQPHPMPIYRKLKLRKYWQERLKPTARDTSWDPFVSIASTQL